MNRDFAEMLAALSAAGAEFLIVGAYAVAVHGHPRATGDLDVWVRPTAQNAARVYAALRAFRAPLSDLTPEDLATPELVFQIGVAPGRVDVLTSITGVAFDEAWLDRLEVTVEGIRVPVISKRHLITNKKATGRTRDLADVEDLES